MQMDGKYMRIKSKMDGNYLRLKSKLKELGYNQTLPEKAVPLVECMLADLLQTTRSLQHYMELSKEALTQRDTLMREAEPYKSENANLIKENNEMHKEIIELKEQNMKITKDSKRKLKILTDLVSKKENQISKLQNELRQLKIKGICLDTFSSHQKHIESQESGSCNQTIHCHEETTRRADYNKYLEELESKIKEYADEMTFLKQQVNHRDSEILRLSILLEGGRPRYSHIKSCSKENNYQALYDQIKELQKANEALQIDFNNSLEKQHEAMLRALKLADKNSKLNDELKKVDAMALKVEEDCNKMIAELKNELNCTQIKLNELTLKNSELERKLAKKNQETNLSKLSELEELLSKTLKEKETLEKEIKDLIKFNETLLDKIVNHKLDKSDNINPNKSTKSLLEKERLRYEKYLQEVQQKLSEAVNNFNKHMQDCIKKNANGNTNDTPLSLDFVRDLHKKLCESEQKILMLKKENEEISNKFLMEIDNNKQNFKDVISQLNAENAELSKENIALSRELSTYKTSSHVKVENEQATKETERKLQSNVQNLIQEIQILKKDKHEYGLRLKEANDTVDKLKRDLAYKQKEIEILQEENNSYKMTYRTSKASSEHLKDECNFLREQMKLMQSEVIKEKTLSSQVKNVQLETERSYCQTQNELQSLQKKLSIASNTIEQLEKKCKELQKELTTMKNDKCHLLDSLKTMDNEHDKLVLELEKKDEDISVLKQKIQCQTFEVDELKNEIAELKTRVTVNKVTEHKIADLEKQLPVLNGEILKLTQQLDTAFMENKHLQNTLAEANGRLKLANIENEKCRKENDDLKQQLQHYVEEVRRIEELLSQKETERSDMLEQFASLSVEANMLENTNLSLESEAASKTIQLQSYISKINSLESKLSEKENIIENQSARITALNSKIVILENEIKLMREEKTMLEQNVSCLKKMCGSLHSKHEIHCEPQCLGDNGAEIKLYENKIKSLANAKAKLEVDNDQINEKLVTTEMLLSNARKEIVELKLALQDATSQTKSLQGCVNRLSRNNEELAIHKGFHSHMTLEEFINDSQDDDEDLDVDRPYLKHSHGSTI